MLQKKANKEVLQPLSERVESTRRFLELFKPGLVYDLVPITDVAGPTGWDPNVQALVVSKETLNGAAASKSPFVFGDMTRRLTMWRLAVEKIRKDKGLTPLRTFVIDVISHSEACLDAEDADALRRTKMSSTFIREWIVQQRQKSASS